MPYHVTCRPRPWGGRHRSGRYFPSGQTIVLQDDEITPGILEDPELVVTHSVVLKRNESAPSIPATLQKLAAAPKVEPTLCGEPKRNGEPCTAKTIGDTGRCLAHRHKVAETAGPDVSTETDKPDETDEPTAPATPADEAPTPETDAVPEATPAPADTAETEATPEPAIITQITVGDAAAGSEQ